MTDIARKLLLIFTIATLNPFFTCRGSSADLKNLPGQKNPAPLCLEMDGNKFGQKRPIQSSVKHTVEDLMKSASLSEEELLARIVLAEGLSVNMELEACRKKSPEIMQALAWGIMNRVRAGQYSSHWQKKFGQGLWGVVFKRGQFNPAVSAKSPFSRYFLCPEKSPAFPLYWQQAQEAARKALKHPQENPFLQTPWEVKEGISLVAHFYYPRSIQATPRPPAWVEENLKKNLIMNLKMGSENLGTDCVWFLRLEQPRPRKDDSVSGPRDKKLDPDKIKKPGTRRQ